MDQANLKSQLETLQKDYDLVAANRMSLDLSRGKPAAAQLDLSNGLEDALQGNFLSRDGVDVRNYGGLRGLPEARELGEEIMQIPAANIIAGGNSSLTLMHFVVNALLQHGLWGDQRRWLNVEQPKLLAPVPGYDRHFVLSEALGVELVTIDINDDGPDMAAARALAEQDPSIKGIWCVPKYSNPTGCTYSSETVEAMAKLPSHAAADDFVVLWDNAYAVHDLNDHPDVLDSIFDASAQHNTADHVIQFASTSKITFAGAGIAFVASSDLVLAELEKQMSVMTIGADKVNQLRHARFLGGRIAQHMQAHAELLTPKFEIVLKVLEEDLGGLGIATWTKPNGGYFVSLDVLPGLASRVVELARGVGLTLTPAGATYPGGKDPEDKNVRIAPTFATNEDLLAAMRILTLCVKLASAQQASST